MACRALSFRFTNADEDPLGREGTGSVVGIQFEVAGMYTGTLITDLIATVQRAEQKAKQEQIALDKELHAIFSMQFPVAEVNPLLMGAA